MTTARPQDIERFREFVTTLTGLDFDDSMKPLLAEVLQERMRAKRSRSAADYLQELARSRRETLDLVGALTVSETYFLRNSDHFRVVESWLRDETGPAQSRRLRILSAGCSSGEEPYSLAIVLREHLADIVEWDVSIHGVDINAAVLERAEAARYTAWSLRETPGRVRQRYFQEQGRYFSLDSAVRSMVKLEQWNLLNSDPGFWQPSRYDIVFCRNVLMYLTLDAARAVVENIERALAPGGLLFLGHAENLRGLSQGFHLRHTHGTFYYERAGARERKPPPRRTRAADRPGPGAAAHAWFDTIEASAAKIAELTSRTITSDPAAETQPAERHVHAGPGLAPAMELMSNERFAEALELLASLPPSEADDADALILKAILLTSVGEPAAAEAACRRLLELDELNAGAHYVMALCREHAGDAAAAGNHDRTAIYLDPAFAMPHLHLGLLLRRAGDLRAARRELNAAAGLLTREDPARIVLFSGGFGRQGLRELCRAELDACVAAK